MSKVDHPDLLPLGLRMGTYLQGTNNLNAASQWSHTRGEQVVWAARGETGEAIMRNYGGPSSKAARLGVRGRASDKPSPFSGPFRPIGGGGSLGRVTVHPRLVGVSRRLA